MVGLKNMYKPNDVIAISKALIKNSIIHVDTMEYTEYHYCQYCYSKLCGYSVNLKNFKHLSDCPVLIAQDLLS